MAEEGKKKATEIVEFIDLFAGIGGFHQAFTQYAKENGFKAKCVYASEIDEHAIGVYKKNYGVDSGNDITKCDPSIKELQNYSVLFAGFPCQAFSKAGSRRGFEDETKGTLFFEIERLLKYRRDSGNPVKYILLENVSNLGTHDKGKTIKTINNHLKELGYYLTKNLVHLSPHQFGVPQLRSRVFILGVHKDYVDKDQLIDNKYIDFKYPEQLITKRNTTSLKTIIQKGEIDEEYYINDVQNNIINMWDEFYQIVKVNTPVIGFPVWAEFFIKSGKEISMEYKLAPKWKRDFINKNLKLYNENKNEIDRWLKKYNNLREVSMTHRKFEWQCGNHCNSIKDGIVQFRPSGIRVKRPTEMPALVAMVQIPIIYDKTNKWRRLTVKEVAKLQSFPTNFKVDEIKQQAYKQFGNSVNVDVVKHCVENLRKY